MVGEMAGVTSPSSVLSTVRALRDREIPRGERWVYSAGFNVDSALRSTGRIDAEIPDLLRLSRAGARVALLAHQGSHRDGTARHLDFVVPYLSRCLGRPVEYVPESAGPAAVRRSRSMRPGDVVLFGNTRMHAGEEDDDPELAAWFAQLGDAVAMGGFSKAHRVHASTVGLLRLLPGYAADSVLREAGYLSPWAGRRADRYSVAVLGGVKPEKTLVGLRRLVDTYDLVIPGGAVLNCLLAASGLDVGASTLGSRARECVAVAREVLLRRTGAALYLPTYVVVAPVDRMEPAGAAVLPLGRRIPGGHAIVDFVLPRPVRDRLATLGQRPSRAVVAGTPARYADGFTTACGELLTVLSAPSVDTVLLGGDTVAELPWSGRSATGGGSALQFLVDGTTPVLEALAGPMRSDPDLRPGR